MTDFEPQGGASNQKARKGLSPKVKFLLSGAVTVVVLALAILGLWAASTPKNQTVPPTIKLSPSQESQNLYTQGLAALDSSETTKAVSLLSQAVTLNPDNSAAKTKLAEIAAAQAAAAAAKTNTPPAPPSVPAPDPFLKAVKNIGALLPSTAAGYVLGPQEAQGPDATRAGNTTDAASAVARALWTVHDLSSPSKAGQFVNGVSKGLYSKDATSVKINGVTAYFGTDGARFATVSFTRGRFAFDVVLTSATGAPAELKVDAIKAAEAFPTKP